MSDFELEVNGISYKGELVTYGYSYKILLHIDGIVTSFEPDEERNFRAIVPAEDMGKVDVNVLEAVVNELRIVFGEDADR